MYRLYTHNDLDGVGCGIIARIAFGKDVDVRYNSVMGLDHQIERLFEQEKGLKDDFLFITDLSVNEENAIRLDDLVKSGGNVRLIDHHKTALHFNDYSWGRIKVNYEDGRLTAATSLLYEYLLEHDLINKSQAIDEFVELSANMILGNGTKMIISKQRISMTYFLWYQSMNLKKK